MSQQSKNQCREVFETDIITHLSEHFAIEGRLNRKSIVGRFYAGKGVFAADLFWLEDFC